MKYTVLWDDVSDLSFTEVCSWLDIPVSRNAIHCPAPYHEDRNPSCKIKDDKFCKCFACGFSANPLKLVQTVKGISKWEALKFINRYTPVIAASEQVLPDEIHLEKWELVCLGLSSDPLYPFRVRTEQNGKTITGSGELETDTALRLINDKFIENCPTKERFLEKFRPYVKRIISGALTGSCDAGKSPSEELWKYPGREEYRKAEKDYEGKVEKYVLKHTGLDFRVISRWFTDGQESMIDRAIVFAGEQHYKMLEKKAEDIVRILEESEKEEEDDWESKPAMAQRINGPFRAGM